ncbi:MAG: YihY/virulence factor BrkB family protein [Deltaproteobacteria bacterium]|nr:YihY/virulence factor BrkB family protein [Deltaproteobacteria bacterium]
MHLSRVIEFLKHDLWRIQLSTLSPVKSFFLRQVRIVFLTFRGFDDNKCALRASALTFYSLLSVVPFAAVAFGIAKGFGIQKLLEKELMEKMEGQEEVLNYILTFANSALEDAKGGIIAGVGVAMVIFLVIKLLGNIEQSFNDIWGVRQSRTWGRRLSNYLSIVFVAPILMIMSSSITLFIATGIRTLAEKTGMSDQLNFLIIPLMKILSYCVVWLLFIFIYIFIPNTRVRWSSGVVAGIIAGTAYELLQWGYITFQIGVSKYGAIYGSFAVLPLFMIWLQLSWLIVLFGAEISFAHQNVETYELEPESLGASIETKRLLALAVTHLCIKRFMSGERPMSAQEIAGKLDTPIRLTNQVLYDLVSCRILSESIGKEEKVVFYQPARSLESLSINFVIRSLDALGSEEIPITRSSEIDRISRCMEDFSANMERSDANLLLRDI